MLSIKMLSGQLWRRPRVIGADSVIICDDRPTANLSSINMIRHMGNIWTTRPEFLRLNPALLPALQRPPHYHRKPERIWLSISLSPHLASMQFGFGYGQRLFPLSRSSLELLQSGKCTASKLITHVFPWKKLKKAFETAVDPTSPYECLVEPW